MNQVFQYVRSILNGHYNVGRLVRAESIEKGFINVSYELETIHEGQTRKFILRCYRDGTTVDRIKFEHALLAELKRRHFDLAHMVIPTKAGATYAAIPAPQNQGMRPAYLALFDFLEGEEEYTWDNPKWTESELADAARILAIYHQTLHGWAPPLGWKGPRAIDLLPMLTPDWLRLSEEPSRTIFDELFLSYRNRLLDIIAGLERSLPRESYDALPHLAVHGDFHPGNLKFSQERVVGVFDFDWANIDVRCFDVAVAIVYFCSVWDGDLDGNLVLEKIDVLLNSYQRALEGQRPNCPGPLSESELALLTGMIKAGNLYVLNWTVSEYYGTRPDPVEYVRYLHHTTRLAEHLESQESELAELALRHRIKI